MKKKAVVLHVSIAVALCAMGFAAPAAADEGPTGPSTSLPGIGSSPPRAITPLDAFIEFAKSIITSPKAASDVPVASTTASTPAPVVPTAAPSALIAPMETPARAVPEARSIPRRFSTYDALVDYATSIATTPATPNDRLAAAVAREQANRAALSAIFGPRDRADLMDDAMIQAIQTQVTHEAATARQLVAEGAVMTTRSSWRLPVVGEDTQDFGPTPYNFEPALTYLGTYYPHFHTGTDIAAPWGTPILAPADGTVIFAGTMGDGAEVVIIAHDSGIVSMYAHLDNYVFRVPVKAGDVVNAGDRIGNVGLTGITTGAHLHWSVWANGELIDPLSMIGG